MLLRFLDMVTYYDYLIVLRSIPMCCHRTDGALNRHALAKIGGLGIYWGTQIQREESGRRWGYVKFFIFYFFFVG